MLYSTTTLYYYIMCIFSVLGTMFNIIELNTTVDELKPINEATIAKNLEPSSPSSTEATKEDHLINNKHDFSSLTKEIEIVPVVNDPSPKLNRTFRKMVPLIEKENFSEQINAGNLDNMSDRVSTPTTTATIPNLSNITEEVFDAITEEPKQVNRKRVIFNSDKKNKYPHHLGRVLG